MVFPWNEYNKHKNNNGAKPHDNRTTKLIAMFLIAILAGGLFIWTRYIRRYNAEKARLEQELKLNQADKNRALQEYKKKFKTPMPQAPSPKNQSGSQLPSGSIPHSSKGSVPSPIPGQNQSGIKAMQPTPITPNKPR
jgi:hypothetical protein